MRTICTFWLNNQQFGFEINLVQEIIALQETTPIPLAPEVVGGLINLRGQLVLGLDLRKRFHFVEPKPTLYSKMLILNFNEELFGIEVDRMGDILELPEETSEPIPFSVSSEIKAMSSHVYILKENVLIVLDFDQLIQTIEPCL